MAFRWSGHDGSVAFRCTLPPRVDRIARSAVELPFDRLYGNFGGVVDADARAIVRASADRYMAWVRGDFDHLT